MEFKKIEITNFGGITNVSTTPKRVNVLIGPNGAGKSTFLKAVKFGLIGDLTRSQLIKDGEDEASVEIDVNSYEIRKTINRTKGTTVYLNGKRTTQKSIVEILQERYGATKESMKFLTSSEVFEKSTGSEFTEFLLDSGIIPLKLNVEKFLDVVRMVETISPQVEQEIRTMFPPMPEDFTIAFIGEKGDEVSALIKAEKKEITRLEGIVSQYATIPAGSIRDPEDIKKDYEAVLAEEAKAESYASIKRKAEATKNKIAELETLYNANPATRPNPANKAAAEKIIDDTTTSIKKTTALKAGFEENNRVLKAQLVRLEGDKCPLSDKLICNQDKSAVKAELQETIDNNDSQITILDMDLEMFEDQNEKAKKVLTDYNNADRAYNQKLNLLQQIDALKNAMPQVPAQVLVSSDIAERKRAFNEELTMANAYQQNLKSKASLEEHKKKMELLQTLERLTSKKGNVKARILKMLLSTLVTSINDMAKDVCPHLTMGLTVGDNGNVLIQCTTHSGTQDYGDLSTGEKLMVQFLVMSQINKLSGFKILIIDNLDKLDGGNFKNLLEFLDSPVVSKYYDHVFIATVDHEDFKNVLSGMPNVNVITV